MKTIINRMFVILFAATFLYSCDATREASNKQKGTVIGASGGAVIGGVVGNQVGDGNTALGAIIGGVVGGAAGSYIGNRMDKQAQRIEEEIPGAEVERVGEGINVTLDETSGIFFETEGYNLNQKSREALNSFANILQEYPDTNILVEGHTDSTGSDAYNLTLSKNRAQAVTDYLERQGVASERIDTRWYGESQPKYDNSTVEGRAKNRRVEIAIYADEELIEEAQRQTQN